jgi:hypothetical protein
METPHSVSATKEISMKATVQKTAASTNRYHHDGTASDAHHNLNPAGDTIVLEDGQYANVRGGAGWTVKALAGNVWITQDGDIRDVVLSAGESFVLDRHGPALLSPLNATKISVMLNAQRTAPQPNVVEPAHNYGHAAFA